ncbi:MBL fold metallo-hydrolase [Stackebrandtia soli]|uniref:MBL fold metallo-hydrolase n=1 Tax=Stackebrandtia soli TaxID=1892856 RepID=UPI0039ECF006
MSYTGRVRPGGPIDVRALAPATITKFSVSEMDNNVYLLRCNETGEQLLIDAAAEPDRVMEVVGVDGLSTVVTTHRHWDHVRATEEVIRRTGAVGVAHVDDAEEIPAVSRTVVDGDTIAFGAQRLDVIHLVGHTPGAIALAWREPGGRAHLFTGDSLFPGGPGKTRTATDFTSLMDDLERKVFGPFDDDTWIYPGHGGDTTLGTERPRLAEWRARGW